jgi:hypothetical protein
MRFSKSSVLGFSTLGAEGPPSPPPPGPGLMGWGFWMRSGMGLL